MYSKYSLGLLLFAFSLFPVSGRAQAGYISTMAGNGTMGSGGSGGPAISCELARPYGIVCLPSGEICITEGNNKEIRKIDATTGNITVLVPADDLRFKTPAGMAADASGNIYVADRYKYRIIKISSSGVPSFVTNGGQGTSPDGVTGYMTRWMSPADVAVDAMGNMYVADEVDHRVKKIDAVSGTLVNIAGNGTEGFSGDGGPATAAQLGLPTGIDVDAAGNVYIADNGNHRIRRVNTDGTITTIAGTTDGYAGDWGPAVNAKLYNPNDIMVSGSNIFIADMNNNRVRMIDAAGIITTVAGNGTPGYGGDGGNAVSAQLYYPSAVARDNAGNLLITDLMNNRIRKVAGIVGVRDVTEDAAMVSVFPNPATDVVQIHVPENMYEYVTLLNSAGSLVLRREMRGTEMQLDMTNLPSGIYYAALRNETHVTMKKVTKL